MFEFTHKQFETNITKEADYTPVYQITKVASDAYQIYSFEDKSAKIHNENGMLKTVASYRGGSYLSKDLTTSLTNLDKFDSVVVTADALSLSKTASISKDKEPWKLVCVNGIEYFIKAEGAQDEEVAKEATETAAIQKTASAKSQKYTVNITAHSLSELSKIADFAPEAFGADPNNIDVNHSGIQKQIIIEIETPKNPHEVQQDIQKGLEQNDIYVPNESVQVFDQQGTQCCVPGCPCSSCCQPVTKETVQVPTTGPAIQQEQDGYQLVSPETAVVAYASCAETLKVYADAHYTNYKITAANGNTITEVKSENESFKDQLNAYLLKSYADSHKGVQKKANSYTYAQLHNILAEYFGETTVVDSGEIGRSSDLMVYGDLDVLNTIKSELEGLGYSCVLNTAIQEAPVLVIQEGNNPHFDPKNPPQKTTASVVGQDGQTKPEGEPLQPGDQVVDEETGKATTITTTNSADTLLHATAEPLLPGQESGKVVDPAEKDAKDTKHSGDDNVKRWKGMREDPTTGKFIVYITETEEHIYDNAEDAIAFLTRK